MNGPCLAAITLDSRGGGVAAVSRLIWRTLQDQWGAEAQLVTLIDGDLVPKTLDSSTRTRLKFGATLARRQVGRQCSWLFYSHLQLGRVQTYIPSLLHRPYAVFLHGIEAWNPLPPADRKMIAGAALRIANSAYTAKRVLATNPGLGPIATVPLAWLPQTPGVGGGRPAPSMGPHVVLVVGRMSAAERYKGHDQLLDAWPAVIARVPDARLVFVGDGDDVGRLRARASATSRVTIAGFVTDEDLDAIFRAAAVFAMPSRGEGFGLVYLEAMSHRLPCIGSVHDAAGEIIDDGVTGFLVDQADAGALAQRLIMLLTDHEKRRDMGERGFARLNDLFTYEKFSSHLSMLLTGAFGSVPAVSR